MPQSKTADALLNVVIPFLKISCLILFIFINGCTSATYRMRFGGFSLVHHVEDPNDAGNFILMNDGSKVYGNKIRKQTGLFVKDLIWIDDREFRLKEVKGYQEARHFYLRDGTVFMQRVVHGKINVYTYQITGEHHFSDGHGGMNSAVYYRYYFYSQLGDNGDLVAFRNASDIRALVAGCPAAEQMASKSNRSMRKASRIDPSYVNSIFEIYNNDCKVVDRRVDDR